MIYSLVNFIKDLILVNIRSLENSNILQLGHHNQNFKTNEKHETLTAHFNFIFFQEAHFSAWLLLSLHLGYFGVDIHSPQHFIIPNPSGSMVIEE